MRHLHKLGHVVLASLVLAGAAQATSLGGGTLSVTGTGWTKSDQALASGLDISAGESALEGWINTAGGALANTGAWSKYYFFFQLRDGSGKVVKAVFGGDWLGVWNEMPAQPWDRIRLENNLGQAQPEVYYCTTGGQAHIPYPSYTTIHPTDRMYFTQIVINPTTRTFALNVYGNGHVQGSPPGASTTGNKWWTVGSITAPEGAFDFTNVNIDAVLWASDQAGATETSTVAWYMATINGTTTGDVAPATVWVDDDYTAATPGWDVTRFGTIQEGVNAVAAGGTVNVAAGTYAGYEVTVDKSVTLKGAQAGVTPVAGGRSGGESVVRPVSGSKYGGFVITADGVTVDGFHAADCYEPFTSEIRRALHKNVTIANNYVTGVNNWTAVSLMRNGGVDSTFQDYTIAGNYIDTSTGRGIGLSAGGGTLYVYDGLTITDNTVKCPANYGIFAGGTVSKFEVRDAVITGNTLTCNSGLNIAKLKNPTITDNTVTAIGASGSGLCVGAQDGVVRDNDITGGVTASGIGINLFGGQYGSWVCGGTQVTQNTVTRAVTGIQVRGGVDGATVSDNTLTDCTTGIVVAANGTPSLDTLSASTDLTDNTIAGTGDTGFRVDGITGPATEIDLGGTTIAATYGEYVQLQDTTLNVDATDTNLGDLGTDAEVEAKVYHDVDVATLGHVDWGQGAATATSLVVSDVSGAVGDTVQLTAKLTAGSAPLAGQSVSFTVDGNAAGSGTTDGAGVAHASYAVTTAGTAPIVASFGGVSNYHAATGNGTLTVAAATATGITLTVTPGSVASGQTATCTVLGSNGVDYTDACTYYVQHGAGGSWADNVYTSAKTGTWVVTAVYNTLTDTESLTVTHGTATSVTLTPATATINSDGSQTYTVTATDAAGNTWTPDASCLAENGAGSFADYTYNADAADAGNVVAVTATVDGQVGNATLNVNAASGPGTTLAWDKDTRKFYLCSNATDPATGTEITGSGTFNGVACTVSGGSTNVTVTAGGASLRATWYLRGGALYRVCQYSTGTASGSQAATYYGGRTLLDGTWRTGYWGLTHTIIGGMATLGSAAQ